MHSYTMETHPDAHLIISLLKRILGWYTPKRKIHILYMHSPLFYIHLPLTLVSFLSDTEEGLGTIIC